LSFIAQPGIAVSDALLGVIFATGVVVSLGASWMLVVRIERVGARLGLSEALLGMLAALAADAPEITAAVTALVRHDAHVGAGVVVGSNVFNLAALLGLAAVVARRIALHRRVIELGGAVALWVSVVCLLVVVGVLSPVVGLLAALIVFAPYLAILGVGHERLARLRLPDAWAGWLAEAVREEELELEVAIHPSRGGARDGALAAISVLVVVGASIAMERTASELGGRHAVPGIVIGGLLLAAVTSLPNAVAAVYLAARGRGAAVLSTALGSNALNVLAGLLLPGAIVGLGAGSGQTTFVAACYLGLTAAALAIAYLDRGLRRTPGALILAAYVAFALALATGGPY
jgi:cation:H+ antiporter